MGYIKHHAIVVTSWNAEELDRLHEYAVAQGCNVSDVVQGVANGYGTVLIAPDGSKEGWQTSDDGDWHREAVKAWLRSQRHADLSSPFEWAEIAYGSDDGAADVPDSEWHRVEG